MHELSAWICLIDSKENLADFEYCILCGTKRPTGGSWICGFCNKLVPTEEYTYCVYCGKRRGNIRVTVSDADLVGVAKKYAGIVPKIAVVDELKTSLEEAGFLLEKFVTDREARKVTIGSLTVYDFPGVRRYLGKIPNLLIEVFLEKGEPLSRASLIRIAGVSVDALDEALRDLEREGIVIKNPSTDSYALKISQRDIKQA